TIVKRVIAHNRANDLEKGFRHEAITGYWPGTRHEPTCPGGQSRCRRAHWHWRTGCGGWNATAPSSPLPSAGTVLIQPARGVLLPGKGLQAREKALFAPPRPKPQGAAQQARARLPPARATATRTGAQPQAPLISWRFLA